jgi:DNA-binding MarR family transcriptional regulator
MHESKQHAADAPVHYGDELLDELDDVMVRMGRLMSSRHVGPDCCPESLTMSQALLLRALGQHGATKMSDIAALLAVKPPAASAAIAQLERVGYVERAIDPDDRRVTLVHVTEEGTAALHIAETSRREAMSRYLSVLSEEDILSLIRIHKTLISAMDEGRV